MPRLEHCLSEWELLEQTGMCRNYTRDLLRKEIDFLNLCNSTSRLPAFRKAWQGK
jgi:hypothetical protein